MALTSNVGDDGSEEAVFWAIWPQARPLLSSYTVLRWEMNLRASTILGSSGVAARDRRFTQSATGFLPAPEHSDPSGLSLDSNQRLDRGTTSLEGRMKTGVKGESRFEYDASRYAAYLETPEGRLRADLAFANLQEFLPASAGVNLLRASISGAEQELPPFVLRVSVFMSPCSIRLRRCWLWRNGRSSKPE